MSFVQADQYCSQTSLCFGPNKRKISEDSATLSCWALFPYLGNEKTPQVFSREKQSPGAIKGNYSDSRGWTDVKDHAEMNQEMNVTTPIDPD